MRACLIAALVAIGAGCGKRPEAQGGGLPPLEVNAAVLYTDYRANAAAADGKYLHARLRVQGQVWGVEESGGGYKIGLFTPPKAILAAGFEAPGSAHDRMSAAFSKVEADRDTRTKVEPGVVAHIVSGYRGEVEKLRNYDPITVVGTCAGRKIDAQGALWVVLNDTVIR